MQDKVGPCGFDHLVLLGAGGEPDLAHFASDWLALIAQSNVAALFRLGRAPVQGDSARVTLPHALWSDQSSCAPR